MCDRKGFWPAVKVFSITIPATLLLHTIVTSINFRKKWAVKETRTKVICQEAESPWQFYPTPHLYSSSGSSSLHLHVLAGGWDPKSSLPLGVGDPHLTQCVIGPHKCTCQMASKSTERFKQGARMWQTDYAPHRAEHASLPGHTAVLTTEPLQLRAPYYGTVFHRT